MKKPGKYLKFYRECIKIGRIPNITRDGNIGGLCGNFGSAVIDLFEPIDEDCDKYSVRQWSYYGQDFGFDLQHGFGPTRQNIVLFLAAMNNEL